VFFLAFDEPFGGGFQFRQRCRIRAERRYSVVRTAPVDRAGPRAFGLSYDKSNLADGATLVLSSGIFPDSARAIATTSFAPIEPHSSPNITKTRHNPSRQRKEIRRSSCGDGFVWLSSGAVQKNLDGTPAVIRSSSGGGMIAFWLARSNGLRASWKHVDRPPRGTLVEEGTFWVTS